MNWSYRSQQTQSATCIPHKRAAKQDRMSIGMRAKNPSLTFHYELFRSLHQVGTGTGAGMLSDR